MLLYIRLYTMSLIPTGRAFTGSGVKYLPEFIGGRAHLNRLVVEEGVNIKKSTTATHYSTVGPATYTPANIFGGYIGRDPAGAIRTDTLPTATVFFAALFDFVEVGMTFPFTVENKSNATDSSEILTVACGTDGSYIPTGTRTIEPGCRMDFELVIKTVTLAAGVYTGTYEVRTSPSVHPLLGSVVKYDSLTTVPKIVLGTTTTVVSNVGIETGYTAASASVATGPETLTFAQLRNGIIVHTGAGATLTLPAATLITTGLGNVAVGDTMYFSIIANDANAITVAVGAGNTAAGGAVTAILANTSARYALVNVSATAYNVYRL